MAIPHVGVGDKITAAQQNDLIDQVNANTAAIEDLGTSERIQFTAVATGGLNGHRLVTRVSGSLVYADNSILAHANAPLWLTLGAAVADAPVEVVSYGVVEESSWNFTVGAPVFLGGNGLLTQTPPDSTNAAFSAVIGIPTSPTTLFIDRQPSVVLA